MKKMMRPLLAAATGAALVLGGAHLNAANAASLSTAYAIGPDFDGAASSDAFIPLQRDIQVSVTLTLKDPQTVTAVSGQITPPGGSPRGVTFDHTPSTAERELTGRFTIGKDDPAGAWQMNVQVSRGGTARNNAFVLEVSGRQGIKEAGVSPNPVRLVRGKDVKVSVKAGVTDAGSVSAKLVSQESGEVFDLGDLEEGTDGYHRGVTFFSDDTSPGEWHLEVYARRGGQSLKGVTPFTVLAPAQGSTKKTRTRVTIKAPNRAVKGRTVKVQGKVYLGARAYPRKRLEVYFKVKGTSTYKLLGFVKSNSAGKYAKAYKVKRDGYFRVKSPGTATARAALSPQEFVDVRP